MFVTAIKNVNRRQQSASTASPSTGYIAVNQNIEIINFSDGDTIDGNPLWYLSAAGEYMWSGGFSLTEELVFTVSTLQKLSTTILIAIYTAALHELSSWFYFSFSECRGLGVGPSNQSSDGVVLSVFLESAAKVPATKNYRGYPIQIETHITGEITASADEIYSDASSPISLGGGSLGEDEHPENSYGTRTALVVSDDKTYILTCYHVACHSLTRRSIMEYNNETINVNIPALFSKSRITKRGRVTEGSLGGQFDYALVAVDNTDWIVDQIVLIGAYNGFYKMPELSYDNLKDVQVKIFGAHTKEVKTGGISAFITDTVTIKYKFTDGTVISVGIAGLIVSSAFSQEGDSGAPVVDTNNKLLGHVIASATEKTFIMPFAYLNYFKSITLNQNT